MSARLGLCECPSSGFGIDQNTTCQEKSLLPLYCGPEVVIHIGSASHEYRIPKALLCTQSSYFAAMFREGHFKEGAEQSTTLEEVDGVVSTQSFELLVQWVFLGRIVFGDSLLPAEAIALSIEFSRLLDMCDITGAESLMAEHIRNIILADARLHKKKNSSDYNANLHSIAPQHIGSAARLPEGHPVRGVLAMAMVEGFFLTNEHKFQEEIQEVPGFAVDILTAVKATSKTLARGTYYIEFTEPLSREVLTL